MCILAAAAGRSGSAGASSSSRTTTDQLKGVEPTPLTTSRSAASRLGSLQLPALRLQQIQAAAEAAGMPDVDEQVECWCCCSASVQPICAFNTWSQAVPLLGFAEPLLVEGRQLALLAQIHCYMGAQLVDKGGFDIDETLDRNRACRML